MEPGKSDTERAKKNERSAQRFDTCGHRLVVAAVPYRINNEGQALVLLINSSKFPEEWLLPKGGWEDLETEEEAALRELWEEAGCRGEVRTNLGVTCAVRGGKEPQLHSHFAVEIISIENEWPEHHIRGRRFFEISEAIIVIGSQLRRKDRDAQLDAIRAFELHIRRVRKEVVSL